jgi:hypothetical protein
MLYLMFAWLAGWMVLLARRPTACRCQARSPDRSASMCATWTARTVLPTPGTLSLQACHPVNRPDRHHTAGGRDPIHFFARPVNAAVSGGSENLTCGAAGTSGTPPAWMTAPESPGSRKTIPVLHPHSRRRGTAARSMLASFVRRR